MKTTLKPCPFCGKTPEQYRYYYQGWMHSVTCNSCMIEIKSLDEDESAKKWNTRHDELTIKKTLLLIVNIAVYSVVLAICAALAWNFYQFFE